MTDTGATVAPALVTVPRAGTVANVEAQWSRSASGPTVHLDLSQCTFIEVAALVYLAAQIAARSRDQFDTQIRLPRALPVRDFLRDWSFAEALSDATGRSFRSLVLPEDRGYFGESSRSSRGPHDLLPAHVFPIRTFFAASKEFGSDLAAAQSREWQERYLLAVLNRHLAGHGRRVSTHIIHEAITNAVRHPHASLLQTASHFSPGSTRDRGFLTIVVWDDGGSIVSTLSRAIRTYGALAPVTAERLHREFVLAGDFQGSISSTRTLDLETPDHVLLLGALFPGVTSLQRERGAAHGDVRDEDELYGLPGMGLYVLLNTVVDVFGGQLAIRTGDYFVNLKQKRVGAGSRLPSIRAKVLRRSPFLGNMLTVRLPITD